MKAVTFVLFIMLTWHCFMAPPVSKDKAEQTETGPDNLELLMHYHRYLKQVVGALENDPEFKKKLEQADEADIRSGKIANELEFVAHHVRTQLDEIKRRELIRLRDLTMKKQELTNNEINDDPNHGHLDHSNPHSFEIEDLRKLIAKTTEDLAVADRTRREEFKQYEMQKEYEKQNKLNHTNGDEREKLEKEFKEKEEKHKKHQPLHEPGHKAQLEEVWEEQDHMQQEFNPKTFFMLHDLDSNGFWDQDEVKALFIKELDKMYQAGAPEDDMRERIEEMERMREMVFQEMDTNRDGFIDFHEFMIQTKKQDFQRDNGWRGLDEEKPFSDEELEAYIRQRQMHHSPPPGYPPYHPNPAYQPQFHDGQGNPQLNMNEIYHQPGQPNYPPVSPNMGQQPVHPGMGQQVHTGMGQPVQHDVGQQVHPGMGQPMHPNIGQAVKVDAAPFVKPIADQTNGGQQNYQEQSNQLNQGQQKVSHPNQINQELPNH